jgi:Glycosyltransferase sugar-binding region containing DXD motif
MIPKIVHFIYFSSPEFPLYGYLAVKSAKKFLKPEKILFYRAHNAPQLAGEWWERARDVIDVITVEPPSNVFGHPLLHVAHQADVFRLQILAEMGGIYLDLDTICRRSFDCLLGHDCVMGHQTKDEAYGLCNAVILARPGSAFLRMWLAEYKSFRSTGLDKYWDEHSVRIPFRLAKEIKRDNPQSLRIEPQASFFDPGFSLTELRRLFEQTEDFPHAYCHHLWSGFSNDRYLKRLSPPVIRAVDTSYNMLSRTLLDH